eukprot:TRINITY_DN27948_c0_g1_i2.p1 TRINITY_DN27948_c0_g1~~TRINITY_DN27948_c0_g1_i2.p1  ORF type:complete len:791 (+),score=174.06 TRINITY_DN27948_c0_g1_i2:675-3047(+)
MARSGPVTVHQQLQVANDVVSPGAEAFADCRRNFIESIAVDSAEEDEDEFASSSQCDMETVVAEATAGDERPAARRGISTEDSVTNAAEERQARTGRRRADMGSLTAMATADGENDTREAAFFARLLQEPGLRGRLSSVLRGAMAEDRSLYRLVEQAVASGRTRPSPRQNVNLTYAGSMRASTPPARVNLRMTEAGLDHSMTPPRPARRRRRWPNLADAVREQVLAASASELPERLPELDERQLTESDERQGTALEPFAVQVSQQSPSVHPPAQRRLHPWPHLQREDDEREEPTEGEEVPAFVRQPLQPWPHQQNEFEEQEQEVDEEDEEREGERGEDELAPSESPHRPCDGQAKEGELACPECMQPQHEEIHAEDDATEKMTSRTMYFELPAQNSVSPSAEQARPALPPRDRGLASAAVCGDGETLHAGFWAGQLLHTQLSQEQRRLDDHDVVEEQLEQGFSFPEQIDDSGDEEEEDLLEELKLLQDLQILRELELQLQEEEEEWVRCVPLHPGVSLWALQVTASHIAGFLPCREKLYLSAMSSAFSSALACKEAWQPLVLCKAGCSWLLERLAVKGPRSSESLSSWSCRGIFQINHLKGHIPDVFEWESDDEVESDLASLSRRGIVNPLLALCRHIREFNGLQRLELTGIDQSWLDCQLLYLRRTFLVDFPQVLIRAFDPTQGASCYTLTALKGSAMSLGLACVDSRAAVGLNRARWPHNIGWHLRMEPAEEFDEREALFMHEHLAVVKAANDIFHVQHAPWRIFQGSDVRRKYSAVLTSYKAAFRCL